MNKIILTKTLVMGNKRCTRRVEHRFGPSDKLNGATVSRLLQLLSEAKYVKNFK